jgi:hypothetical protein
MALMNDLLASVVRLVQALPVEWSLLLRRATQLDTNSPTLATDLLGPCAIDRSIPGFEDFSLASTKAITPGDPALSALYHFFASPLVQPPRSTWWPSPDDLDLIENFIYTQSPLRASGLPPNGVVGVFAYEYRPAASTAHRVHADLVYSRTGIARVGEAPAVWNGQVRCWNSLNGDKFVVMPARYAAFLAVPRKRSITGASVIGDPQDGDDDRTFLVPVRKLVNGEDFDGKPLKLEYSEFHRKEKLRRLFVVGGFGTPDGINSWPYVRESDSGGPEALVDFVQTMGSARISSPPAPLVRQAKLPNGEAVTLKVPPRSIFHFADVAWNRSASSLRINTGVFKTLLELGAGDLLSFHGLIRPRNAPEFANIRHRVDDPMQPPTDLSLTLGNDFRDVVDEGGYQAAMYEDSVCDGCISVRADLLSLPVRPAFSVVTAPDYFPFADEIDINDWVETFPNHNAQDQFKNGGPDPLCHGRLPANITLHLPGSSAPAFDASDTTAVAIVGRPYVEAQGVTHVRPTHRTTTFLSDGASNVFAPGWDVTFAEENGVKFYATFGLGSPFPEDAKLCAAANGFWPAASPDAARTFQKGPTAIPLLDEELGWHPQNPLKPAGVTETLGWDGEQGPFIAGQNVNFADFWRSDYVSNALNGRFLPQRLEPDDSEELIARMDCLRLCIQSLPDGGDEVSATRLWLVHAQRSQVPVDAAGKLDDGYRFEFVIPRGSDQPDPADKRRRLQGFSRRFICLVSRQALSWQEPGGPLHFVQAPAPGKPLRSMQAQA